MLKLLGAGLIMTGAVLFGQELVIQMNLEYQELLDLKEFILMLATEMVHYKTRLPLAFERLQARVPARYTDICERMTRALGSFGYTSPSAAWKMAAEEYQEAHQLGEEAFSLFLQVGRMMDQSNGRMQEEEQRILVEEADELLRKKREENVSRKKISRYLCVSAGALLVIVLI